MANGSVGNSEIQSDAVTTDKILDGTISGNDISISSINDAHINNISISKLISAAGQYFTYQPNGVACLNGEILSWDSGNGRWICSNALSGAITTESDPIWISEK